MTSITKALVQAKLKTMAPKFPPGTLCVYCAETPATTTDHVPPKGFFAKGHRPDLIRVPACRGCNGSFSTEDEYARQIFTMAAGADDSIHVREARARAVRSMQRPDHRRMLEATHRNFSLQSVRSNGLYRRQPAQQFDRPRISRFIARIVCALFYQRYGRILPPSHTPVVEMLQDDPLVYHPSKRDALRRTYAAARGNEEHTVADDAFQYAVISDEDWGIADADPNHTSWAILFYGCLNFVAFTPNRDLIDADRAPYAFQRGL